jgi:hypothetical protein
MRLTIKLIVVLMLLLLVSFLILINGCGKALTGHGSGGCPDSTAPDGSTITVPTLGAPSVNGSCYPTLVFTVRDLDGAPLNGICVEVFAQGSLALHSGPPDCSNVIANPQSAIVTRTDDSGNVVVEFATPPATAGTTFSIQVTSGGTTGLATTPAAQ